MIERGLLIEQSPGQGYDPLACYAVSPKLKIALAARSSRSSATGRRHT
jgi:hypothetical protein